MYIFELYKEELITKMNEIDLIPLGDTLFSLIKKGSELFELNLIKSKKMRKYWLNLILIILIV